MSKRTLDETTALDNGARKQVAVAGLPCVVELELVQCECCESEVPADDLLNCQCGGYNYCKSCADGEGWSTCDECKERLCHDRCGCLEECIVLGPTCNRGDLCNECCSIRINFNHGMDQEADLDTGLLQVDNDDIWFKFEESEPRRLNGFACAHADERGVLVVCTDPVCIEAFEKAGQAISRNTASGDNTQDDGEEDGNEDGTKAGAALGMKLS